MNVNEILDLFSYSKQIVVNSGNLTTTKETLRQIQEDMPKHNGSSFENKNKAYLQNAESFLVKKISIFESGVNSDKKRLLDLEKRRAKKVEELNERKKEHSHYAQIQESEAKNKAAKASK